MPRSDQWFTAEGTLAVQEPLGGVWSYQNWGSGGRLLASGKGVGEGQRSC